MNVSSGNRERRVTIREIHRQVQLLSMYVVVHTVHSRPKIQKKVQSMRSQFSYRTKKGFPGFDIKKSCCWLDIVYVSAWKKTFSDL